MKFNNYLSEKDQPDFTGTGIKPEDGWKTPEQLEQDKAQSDVDSKTQKENQKEKIYNDELDRLKKRDDLIHTKLGRILATPEELEELDKEREEREEFENKIDSIKNIKENSIYSIFVNEKESASAIKAKKLGLTSMGKWGKWGKNGKITHITKNGELVPVKSKDSKNSTETDKTTETNVNKQEPKQLTAQEQDQQKERALVDFKKEKEEKQKQKEEKEKNEILNKKKEYLRNNTQTTKEKPIPTGEKAEPEIADAINGKATANKLVVNVIKKFQKEGLIPKGSIAEVVGSSSDYKLSDGWESKSNTPKTDMLIRDKNGKVVHRVSIKTGKSQLMSGMKSETRSVLKSIAKNLNMEDDPQFKKIMKSVNSFVHRMKVDSGGFGSMHTQKDEEIRKFNKETTRMFRQYVDTNEDFRHALIKEAMTGENKFGKKSEAMADSLLYLDPKGDPEKSSFVKINNALIKKIGKKVSFNVSMKSVGGYTSTSLRLQVAGVITKWSNNYLTEDINKNDIFDMFDISITPVFPDDFDISELFVKNEKSNVKLQEHFETYTIEEDD